MSTLQICSYGGLLYMILFFIPTSYSESTVSVVIHENILHTTESKFLSVAIDSNQLAKGFPYANMSDTKLIGLMKPLAPAYLRFGGIMADRLTFNPNDTSEAAGFGNGRWYEMEYDEEDECESDEHLCMRNKVTKPHFNMSGSTWRRLNKLAKESGLRILFDLNSMKRLKNGNWDSKNAEDLISFSANHKYEIDWELGNEPNSYIKNFNYEIKPEQLVKDLTELRRILNNHHIYSKSKLVGPDITQPKRDKPKSSSNTYIRGFLPKGKDVVDSVTFHHYYFDARTATESDFLDTTVMNKLGGTLEYVQELLDEAGAKHKPLWLGETSSAYGGGTDGLSNAFAATFLWLDKLGLTALKGLSLLIRQSLVGGNYSLLDQELEPLPDWWLSVIYKKLVDPRVISCQTTGPATVRLYCHCSKTKFNNTMPSVVVFGLNTGSSDADVSIHGVRGMLWQYRLTSNSLKSKRIILNSKLLNTASDGTLPRLEHVTIDTTQGLTIPRQSLVFWIVPKSVSGC